MQNDDPIKTTRKPGSGRKSGTGTYKENTSVMRVPDSQKPVIANFLEAYAKKQRLSELKDSLDSVEEFTQLSADLSNLSLPLFESKVPAGLPSPADDHIGSAMDPNEYLINKADKTFFVTIQGESMIEVGLMPGDKAIVEKDKVATVGDIVLAMIDGEFTVKILAKQKDGKPKLLPANSSGKYAPILIQGQMQFAIWGVVTGSFRKF
ncbi:LexA family transcriptional regulator [Methylophilus sp.]|jgi:DNA polymerase V|uniref:LexA family protein n=1 Tax=Methylophilus sp. TaxID=29541 RepID=UPI0011DA4EC2|nr:translesion error-prone DNA polymerase V autoproteolytic subunit [Methylophilus sp.]TXI47192.1 MAG: translesion error-prone DNA polymerase V autoproteolytic subunit [Methylophilus sp.]